MGFFEKLFGIKRAKKEETDGQEQYFKEDFAPIPNKQTAKKEEDKKPAVKAPATSATKKTADKKHDSLIKEYLNFPVITAYTIFFLSTVCTMIAYKKISLSSGPILETLQYIFIAVLSVIFLKEKISKKKMVGLIIIFIGVIIFSL